MMLAQVIYFVIKKTFDRVASRTNNRSQENKNICKKNDKRIVNEK